jgi:DNA primase
MLDGEAVRQASTFGLVLVEGFFDVAKLVEAGCRNVGALMGTHISLEQIERLSWIRSRIGFPRIVLLLDRDQPGRDATLKAEERLLRHDFEVNVFDWDRNMSWNGQIPEPIPDSIQDPGDMSVEQLQSLRNQSII